jgi:hypothetical protein
MLRNGRADSSGFHYEKNPPNRPPMNVLRVVKVHFLAKILLL